MTKTDSNMIANPLLRMLDTGELPPFPQIRAEHAEPALDAVLADHRALIAELQTLESPTWDTLVAPLEARDNALHRVFSPIGNLFAVNSTAEWRAAYTACVPKLSAYASEVGQNRALFERFEALKAGDEYATLSPAQQTVIDHALRDFRLAGVDLDDDARARVTDIQNRLSELTTQFEAQLLDATQAWSYLADTPDQLAGLPQRAIDQAKAAAASKDMTGYLLTLDAPSYQAAITYADNRELRQAIYEAYATRASDQGPNAEHQADNLPLIDEILALRAEVSKLTGFSSYAHRSLATKMAPNPQAVEDFLTDLASRARGPAQAECDRIAAFAKQRDGLATLEAWDVSYYSEKLKETELNLSDEDLRPYFELDSVLAGMMDVAGSLYGVSFKPDASVPVWHDDVRAFEVLSADGGRVGQFLVDPYARANKRAGAWMDDCQGRFFTSSKQQLPVAFLVCNFGKAAGNAPALLSHTEVVTLFHEFGHGLHHLLTQIDVLGVSGISGVAWDAVELPSQFMENWAWERDALDRFARHHETGETIPSDLFAKLTESRRFMTGLRILRQVEFALFDLRIHSQTPPVDVLGVLDATRDQVAVMRPPEWHRFPCAFSHIFAGGYAAGYYSYHWAEVLAADAFGAFADEGIFNADTGQRFLTRLLSQGGSRPAAELFEAFRGRQPEPDALLAQYGLAA